MSEMTSEERAVIDAAVARYNLYHRPDVQATEWAESDLAKAVARLIESRNQWMKPGKRLFTVEDGKSLDIPPHEKEAFADDCAHLWLYGMNRVQICVKCRTWIAPR
jgi:hypothetical protein